MALPLADDALYEIVDLEPVENIGAAPRADRVERPSKKSIKTIDLDEEGDFISLSHLGLTVKLGEALPMLRESYKGLWDRQAQALDSYLSAHAKQRRRLQDNAAATDSAVATKQYLIDRHSNEWSKDMLKSKKLLEEEVQRAKDIFDAEMVRESEEASFLVIMREREGRLSTWRKDEKTRIKIFQDLKTL
ncbi:hypothetical protein LTR08_006959 [Meristemomyces frigidus]|nr:hypothetical protein LTR08_006959 [Meristemomyces frigidus]